MLANTGRWPPSAVRPRRCGPGAFGLAPLLLASLLCGPGRAFAAEPKANLDAGLGKLSSATSYHFVLTTSDLDFSTNASYTRTIEGDYAYDPASRETRHHYTVKATRANEPTAGEWIRVGFAPYRKVGLAWKKCSTSDFINPADTTPDDIRGLIGSAYQYASATPEPDYAAPVSEPGEAPGTQPKLLGLEDVAGARAEHYRWKVKGPIAGTYDFWVQASDATPLRLSHSDGPISTTLSPSRIGAPLTIPDPRPVAP